MLISVIAALISLSALVLFAIALPARYTVLLREAEEGASALQTLMLSPTAVAIYNLGLEILVTLINLALGLIIVARRRNDGIGLFMVTMLILNGATSSLTIRFLAAEDMRWVVPENIIRASNYILNLIILSVRPGRKGKDYEKIWNREKNESYLKTITRSQAEKLDASLANDPRLLVDWAMRYGNPSIASRLEAMQKAGCDRILIVPLYPQYAAATTATVADKAFEALSVMRWQPALRVAPGGRRAPSSPAGTSSSGSPAGS